MEKKTLMATWKIFLVTFLCLLFLTIIAEAGEVVVCSWGGDYEKAFMKAMTEPFEKATGIKVIVTSWPTFTQAKAMVDSGNVQWDIIDIEGGGGDFQMGVKAGLFEPLDYNIIDKKGFYPDMVHPYGIGLSNCGGVLAYRTKIFPAGQHPKSWADFWDVKKFPGKRALMNNPKYSIPLALLADGVPKDKLYPLDVDRAFRSLDKIKPHISVWWTRGAQAPQLLTDGEVDMTLAWSGRITGLRRTGVPIDFVWNQATVCPQYLAILKGSKNKKEAMQLIAFCAQVKPQAEFNEAMDYGPANEKALQYMDHVRAARDNPMAPVNVGKLVLMNGSWWADHLAKVTERWQDWMLK